MKACRLQLRGPDIRDPRLQVAAVVLSLHVLGQTVLHFDVSIAQILIAIATCAVIEIGITLWHSGVLAWPASALLTGSGVAFVLRVPGTEHGEWWSLRGAWIFAAVAAVALLSKYVIRIDGRPLFNPSNFGLVLCFLVLGSRRVDPLDFWWIRPGLALAVALAVIVVGGLVLAWRVNMLGLVATFWLTYATSLAVLAIRGHCITARWHIGPVCDRYFWTVLITSPEVLVFMFFMITDPKTAPRGRTARIAYGAAIALVFVALAAPQRTEYATKVALLGSLTLTCAARPLLERLSSATSEHTARRRPKVARQVRAIALITVVAVVYAAIVVGAGAPAETSNVKTIAAAAPSCNDAATGTARPRRPAVPAAPVPTVTVHDAVDVATPIDPKSARAIVRDVADDLEIASIAIARRDPSLAAAAATFPWIDDLVGEICSATGPLVATTYRLARATVTVAKRSAGQAYPEIDVSLQGRARESTRSRAQPHRVIARHDGPYRQTLVVAEVDGSWLICGHRNDPRTQHA